MLHLDNGQLSRIHEEYIHSERVTEWYNFPPNFQSLDYIFEEVTLNMFEQLIGQWYRGMLTSFVILGIQLCECFQDTILMQGGVFLVLAYFVPHEFKETFSDV